MISRVTESRLAEPELKAFQDDLKGQLFRPGSEGYETSRHVFNAMIEHYPALIVHCAGVADVIVSVRFARDHHLPVSVRGGGHGVAGHAVGEGALMLDLSGLRGVRVDPTSKTVRAEAGITWRSLDHETQAFGLATTGGTVSMTGIAGFTLGGGLGWLMGRYGLACDNLLSADLVTADGRFVHASESENADMFWGVRGGGGNFGVATALEFRLHPVSNVLAGVLFWPIERATEVISFFRDFTWTIPEELGMILALATAPDGSRVVALASCFSGPVDQGVKVLAPIRRFADPLMDTIAPMRYEQAQIMLDETAPSDTRSYWKSAFMHEISEEAVEKMVRGFARTPSPLSMVHIWSYQGMATRVRPEATAFANRTGRFLLHIVSDWKDPEDDENNMRWAKGLWEEMQPHLANQAYSNFADVSAEKRIRAAFGENYARLVQLKQKYDPTNMFRFNQNISPDGDSRSVSP
jgi:hypothetical protein